MDEVKLGEGYCPHCLNTIDNCTCGNVIVEQPSSGGYVNTNKPSTGAPVFDNVSQEYEKLISEANKEVETWKTKYTYLLADLENVKKRNAVTIDKLQRWGNEDIILDLLEVIDDMERSIKFESDSVTYGFYSKLINILSKNKVKPIYENRPVFFNGEYDNAVVQVPTNDNSLDNTIVEVSKKGYEYNGKIIRYEDVIVNKYNK